MLSLFVIYVQFQQALVLCFSCKKWIEFVGDTQNKCLILINLSIYIY